MTTDCGSAAAPPNDVEAKSPPLPSRLGCLLSRRFATIWIALFFVGVVGYLSLFMAVSDSARYIGPSGVVAVKVLFPVVFLAERLLPEHAGPLWLSRWIIPLRFVPSLVLNAAYVVVVYLLPHALNSFLWALVVTWLLPATKNEGRSRS